MDWRDHAACRPVDPELFFPVGLGPEALRQEQRAQQVCQQCRVRVECLTWAMDAGITDGVFGGLSDRERRELRQPENRRRKLPAPTTGKHQR